MKVNSDNFQASSLTSGREIKDWLGNTPKIKIPSPKENPISINHFFSLNTKPCKLLVFLIIQRNVLTLHSLVNFNEFDTL